MKGKQGLTLVVLAAGMGSRFGGLKQLEPLSKDGNILIEYSVYDAIRAGFDKVVFIVRRSFIEDFEKLVANLAKHVTVEYAFQDEFELPGLDLPEREKPWGTGHALLAAEHLISGPMAVINADDYYGQSAYATAAAFLEEQANESMNFAMLGYVLKSVLSPHGTVSRGICRLDDKGKLSGIVEHTKVAANGDTISALDGAGKPTTLTEAELASMNFWLFTPAFFPLLRREMHAFAEQHRDDAKAEFLLPDIVGRLLERGEASCDCLAHDDTWFGMTHREDRESAVETISRLHADGSYPSPLWAE